MTADLREVVSLYRECERIRKEINSVGNHLASDRIGELDMTVTTEVGTSTYSFRDARDIAFVLRRLEDMFEDELREAERLFHQRLEINFAKEVAAAT
jgi:hypothetical protein